jgi:hypothetical protein
LRSISAAIGHHPVRSLGWLLLLALLVGAGPAFAQDRPEFQEPAGTTAGRPGHWVLEAASDSSSGFRWLSLPSHGVRCLTWDGGALVLPLAEPPERFGVDDLTVPYSAELVGVSQGRRMVFEPGRYRIEEPVLLTDGTRWLFLSAGEMTVEPALIQYRREFPGSGSTDRSRAQYLFLGALVILIAVLLLRVRSRLRES